ncbi:MAG: hypothetical protein ACYC1Y_00225 [Minisyncoccota bacterium]
MDAAHKERVTKILIAAAAAPSGDNSQPWRFVVHESSIEFHYLPERDNPILNYEEGGTLIALGAALQNADLEARAQGYAPSTTLNESGSCVAIMRLSSGGDLDVAQRPMREAIFKRHTNRKAYGKISLSREMRATILGPLISGSADLKLFLIESQEAMGEVSRALTMMEETALANKALHTLFFSSIFWSEAKNRAGEQGLYIKTLELPPPVQALFRLLKHWRFAKLLAKVGFPRFVAQTNAQQNASASALGVITALRLHRGTYLEAGKMLERVWLLATAQGLSLQIVTGITFLARSINNHDTARLLSDDEQERVRAAYATIKRNVDDGHEPIIAFRIGTSNGPTEVTYRRTPEIIFA